MVRIADLLVPEDVMSVRKVPKWTQLIPVSTTTNADYLNDPSAHNDKGHLLLCLSVKHCNENFTKRPFHITGNKGWAPAGNPNQRQKVSSNKANYNRMVFFADCLESGMVVCKILETQKDSTYFFRCTAHCGYGVGSLYVIEEPSPVTQYLGKDSYSIPLLEDNTRVYAVTCKTTINKVISPAPLKRPVVAETKYFVYHKYKELKIGGSTFENSSCGGAFCDRQSPTDHTLRDSVSCGCFHAKDNYKFVTQHEIEIPCDGEINSIRSIVVHKFRSYRFDQLLFRENCQRLFLSVELGDPICNRVIREQVRALVSHVNKHSGWTIVGWVRTGRTKDVSDDRDRTEDIASEDLRPHVIYLYPTDPKDCTDENAAYKAKPLRYTETKFRQQMKQIEHDLDTEETSAIDV